MAVGIVELRGQSPDVAFARDCFHAATGLYAWALGADRRLAFAWDRLGFAYHRLGDADEAESCYLRSLAIQDQARQRRTVWNDVTLLNLASLYAASGRPALRAAGRDLSRDVASHPALEAGDPP